MEILLILIIVCLAFPAYAAKSIGLVSVIFGILLLIASLPYLIKAFDYLNENL
jgi:hypothetical protein